MVELTLKRKLEVIGEISGGSSYRKISKKYGISVGTVTIINKNKARIFKKSQPLDARIQSKHFAASG